VGLAESVAKGNSKENLQVLENQQWNLPQST